MKTILILILSCLLLSACAPSMATADRELLPRNHTSESTQANLPNPASVYCEGQGNRLEIRTSTDGSQAGFCIFTAASHCETNYSLSGKGQRVGEMIIASLKMP